MTENEMKFIQLDFQLFYLISENKDDELGDEIRDKMDVLWYSFDQQTQDYLNNIACYCYSLIEKGEIRERYRQLLFAKTLDRKELHEIYAKTCRKEIEQISDNVWNTENIPK